MRERLLSRGPEALADHEILEMLLFLGIPRRDTRPVAKELINRFGSLAGVLTATPQRFAHEDGLGADAVAALLMPHQAALRLMVAEVLERPVLNNGDQLLEYFDTALSGAPAGQLRALLLDNRNRLLADEVLAEQTDGLAQSLGRRALDLHATALILVRVLPPGMVEKGLPQREALLSGPLSEALSALSVVLHDHMLVGGGNWVSLRQHGLL